MESSRVREIKRYIKYLNDVHLDDCKNLPFEYNLSLRMVPDYDRYALGLISWSEEIPNLNYHTRIGLKNMLAVFHYQYIEGIELYAARNAVGLVDAILEEMMGTMLETWTDIQETYNIYLEALGHK